jgi:hypothetical protein
MHTVKARPRPDYDKHYRWSPPACTKSDATSSSHPPQRLWWLEILVQSFVDAKGYCSADAHRVFLKEDLPLSLERVAARISPDRQIWLAWTSGQHTRFITAQMAPEARVIDLSTAIHLFFYDVDGQLQASGKWGLHTNGKWILHSVDMVNTSA